MDVGAWLRGLGLGQYEDTFRESEIEADVLPELTEADLEKLGLPLGPRKRILKAIAVLTAPGKTAAVPIAAPATPSIATGERRQLTVMFCDLVGSTVLSSRLDPEDMGELIRGFQSAVAAAVGRFDGHVAKLMGDGALVYFGYPRAHEDDAERAARAGLKIVEAIGALRSDRGLELEVRAGIATGLVVVGELMGEGEARERGVVGETPNLAARLQALAEPGSIVIAEATRRLLGGMFELRALGPQTLKGFAAPVSAWTVVREAENLSRFEAARSDAMTPFVGREHEVALLLDRWRDASAGEGQVVLLSGEAGIGKSRILVRLRQRIREERHIILRYQCSPHHVNDAFHPLVGQIWHAAGFVSGEAAAARLDKLEAMIALSGLEAKEIAPYLASLLSIATEGRYPTLEMAPSEQKERTIAAFIALFVGLANDAPVLALLEDAHWIDPTSLDVFGQLVDRLPNLRALLVVAFRPEFPTPWLGRAHVTGLSLNRLGRRQAATMIDRVTGGKALPAEVLEQIVAKTDGVPLFVEELTRAVLEGGLLREENGAYAFAAPLTPLAIPPTLQDTLMARLDRLAPVKEIAQIGAAIGREFSYRLLQAVSPITGPALQDALGQLMAAELIYGRGAPPDVTYVFKHALVQDTAYSSLLRSRRQRIHAEIARALAERFADQVEAAPAVIARHYTEAGLLEPAARYWLAAAELAHLRATPTEASHYAEAGLALLPRIPEGPDHQSLELALQIANANALLAMKGYNAPETLAALNSAKRLLDAGVGSDLQRFTVLYGLGAASYIGARMQSALALAREIVEVANRQDDTTYRLVAHRLLGTVQGIIGQLREGLASLVQAEQYREPDRDRRLSYRFGLDVGLDVLNWKTILLRDAGLFEQWARVVAQVRAEVVDHWHSPTIATCSNFAVFWPDLLMGDLAAAERHTADMIAYCAEKKIAFFGLIAAHQNAVVHAMRSPTRENIAACRPWFEAQRAIGMRLAHSAYLGALAEAALSADDVESAQALLQEAFVLTEESGETAYLSALHRIDGLAALKRGQPDFARAEACFCTAIDVARSQGARMNELAAAYELVRLRRNNVSGDNSRALLEMALGAIEGGETVPLVSKARALLAELT